MFDEEPINPVCINKYDPYQLKGTIDDTLIILLEEKGFKENNYINNLKIALGLVCIALAAFS